MKKFRIYTYLLLLIVSACCHTSQNKLDMEVYETSAGGNKLEKITGNGGNGIPVVVQILQDQKFQTIIGFGGSFTESSAYLLNQLSRKNRDTILRAYFGEEGARYSLTRTHINSCDFSLRNYSYAPIANDMNLENFSIEEDRDDIIPMIKDAMEMSKDGFKIISSPWTAPPWMKDNQDWIGGKLLPEYYDTWALFFSKYMEAYKDEGIGIWGITVVNEPLGNGNNWESMHFTPQEMLDFVNNHLGPRLEKDGFDVILLAYDQNRGKELEEWANVFYRENPPSKYVDGFAVHWYNSTYDWFPQSLNHTHELAPDKMLIHTEGCVDAEMPHWKEDAWYWTKEATDWGWDWASEDDKPLHPKYVPVYRYARNIIGSLNSWVQGWIDWNMVLDRQGGPNWAKNWCVAPVIVDPEKDEVYFTPLYFTMAHFSKFIRPGAVRIGFENPDESLMVTAAENPDGTVVVIILNMNEEAININLEMDNKTAEVQISPQALQTVVIRNY
ncbi:MAG: glycoside hydrolase family 30 protein [Bacteroidales bacterium]|nr:glycoside hydrolase family 30 protein [Bacteroidales bacterium]